MNNKYIKNWRASAWIVLIAMFFAFMFVTKKDGDRYSNVIASSSFRSISIEGFTGDSRKIPEYNVVGENSVRLVSFGPISLKPAKYSFDLQFGNADDNTIFKIYSPDYVAEDNSGGKVFIYEKLNPKDSSLKGEFELAQEVDSLFVVAETHSSEFLIGRCNLKSDQYVFSDTWYNLFLTVLFTFIALIAVNADFKKVKPSTLFGINLDSRQTAQIFILVGFCAVLLSSLPLLNKGIEGGHDLNYHLARITGLSRALKSGQLPSRIHGGVLNNYGYPNGYFYPELLLYVPSILVCLGVSVYASYKAYIVFVNIITLVVAYIAFKKMSKSRTVAISAAVLYTIIPYRIVCAYFRAAIGEFTAITFLPFVVYGIYAIIWDNSDDWIYLVLGATGVLQSHILSTELTAVFALIIVLFGIKPLFTQKERLFSLVKATIATVLVNLWFLLPMVILMFQHGLLVFKRVSSVTGFGHEILSIIFETASFNHTGPYPVGVATVFAVIFWLIFRIVHKENSAENTVGDIFLLLTCVFAFMQTGYFPWTVFENLPLIGTVFSSIQFPYRVMTITCICSICLFVMCVKRLSATKNGKYVKALCLVLMVAASVNTINLYENKIIDERYDPLIADSSHYRNNLGNQMSVGNAEYLVEGAKLDKIVENLPVIESNNTTLSIRNFKRYGTNMSFDYSIDLTTSPENYIVLPVMYLPNYKIICDGVRIQPVKYEDAKVAFIVNQPQGSVEISYSEPKLFRLSELVSAISIAGLVAVEIRKHKKLHLK